MLPCASYQTRDLQPYFFVNPLATPFRCYQTRFARLLVTPR
jgi:hypothetical protein